MKTTLVFLFVLVSQAIAPVARQQAAGIDPIAVRTATVDGLTLQYLTAGHGPAIVLLHGYAESSRMWRPLIPKLAEHFTVIAPDLPGIGGSDIPKDGLDMKSAAVRMHALVKQLGVGKAVVVGHDIGLMVAYAYAAQFPTDVEKLVLMDAFLPGVEGWETIYNSPAIWHFRFNGPTAEALVRGRERTYFDHFWNNFAADKTRSIPEADRQAYAAAYARPGRMRSAWAYFVSFQQAAKDFAQLAQTKLTMPVLTIGGEKANGDALGKQAKLVAVNAASVVLANTGHWVMEESPRETTEALMRFLQGVTKASTDSSSAASSRLVPTAADARGSQGESVGLSANRQFRPAGRQHQGTIRRPVEEWLLHDRVVRSGAYDHPGAFASRRSHGDGRVGNMANRVRRSVRRRCSEDVAARQRLFRAGRRDSFRADRY
jgi:pimeloyl-ACP methyl ester carboxylesterase